MTLSEHEEHAAWRRFMQGHGDISWQIWGAPLNRTPSLTARGREAATWALKELSAFFGEEWLSEYLRPRARERQEGRFGRRTFMDPRWWPPSSEGALRRLLQLAAQLRLLAESDGFPALRDRAHGSATDPRFVDHLLVQLEVAALALRSTEAITFELSLPSGATLDLAVGSGALRLAVEVSVRGSDRDVRTYEERQESFTERILLLMSRHGVSIAGKTGALDDADAVESWLGEIEKAAADAASDGRTRRVLGPGGGVMDIEADPAGLLSLKGPQLAGNQMAGLAVRIHEKAQQTAGVRSLLRIDENAGLWYLTPWATGSLPEKLAQLTPVVQEACDSWPHVAAVALSTRLRSVGGMSDETVTADDGSLALRRDLRDGFYREILVVATGHAENSREATRLRAWYETEVDWLDWALSELGYPPVEELFVSAPIAS